jgi:hypothetical protein
MINWNEAISRVKNVLKEVNADSRLSNKQIVSSILTKSQLVIQRESDKLKLIKIQDIFQSLNCIEMQEVSTIDDCCGVDSVCTVMRSKYKIPEMYNDDYGIIIKRITTIDESQEINLSTPSNILRAKKDTNSKYDKTIYAFFRNNYLFITNRKYPVIKLEAFFKEDLAFNKIYKCGTSVNKCLRFLDTKWVVPEKLQEGIIGLVIQELASLYKKLPEDINITKNPNA